ncbi:MAG: ribonuclease Z [Muribaculaceae bacterium]|nr:ribonuclease Z [Muribaculaceae bacterium]
MSTFKIHTLGCGSAKPTLRHQPSCTVVEHRDNLFMVDCGEGAQLAFQRQRLRFSRLRHVFLTHLHGDHVLGLPGLVSTLGLGGAGGILTVHTFAEGKKILQKIFNFFGGDLPFEVEFNVIEPTEGIILDTPSLTVRTVPLKHRVPTVGYIFEEKEKLRHIKRDMIDFHQVPTYLIRRIKAGEDFIKPDGTVVPHELLTSPATPPLSYAHISDTAYMPELAEKIGPVDLLFHETTYTEAHKAEAAPRGHSTAKQAAMVARDAEAKALLTGHYSSRYHDDTLFLKEAREIFPNVILNKEGLITNLD